MLAPGKTEAQLIALVEQQAKHIELLLKSTALLEENAALLQEKNDLLSEQVAHLSKHLFGRKSERLQPGQLDLYRTGILPEVCAALETVTAPSRPSKKTGRHGRGSLPDHLLRVEHILDLPEEECSCSVCKTPLNVIGEQITERAHFVPATITVNRYVRKKYACPHGHEVKTADLPAGVVEGSKYDASVHAHVAVAKYNDHVPLNRLQGIFKRQGIKLPRQTMWDMLVRIDAIIAQPVLKQMRKELLEEPILHADETSVVLRIEDQKGSKKGWVWGWRNEPLDRKRDPSKVLIEFHLGRGGEVPEAFLGKWSEILIVDGYSSYNPISEKNGITRAGCWAHARRPFRDALEMHPKWAALPLLMINRLFALERAVGARVKRLDLDVHAMLELRKTVRERSSKKLMDKLFDLLWELDAIPQITPQSKLGKGIRYALNQEQRLRVCLDDPRVPIHNNDSERDLRHIILGRNNWMVFASQRGGEIACRMYSLMLSCRQNDIHPEEYLADVLMAAETTPSADITSLTPWAWKARQDEQTQDI